MFWTIVLGIVVGGIILMALPTIFILFCWAAVAFVDGVAQTFRSKSSAPVPAKTAKR